MKTSNIRTMKTIRNIVLGIALLLGMASCNDFLETSSPSTVDADFVFSDPTTARAALYSMYEQWRTTADAVVFGEGLFYAADIAGSDIERHPEGYLSQSVRHIPETFYENGTKTTEYTLASYDKENGSGAYSMLYSTISKANSVITAIEEKSDYQQMINQTTPSLQSQMYGEAIAMRATCYMELIRYYGDVPYLTQAGVEVKGLSSRDSIYDSELNYLVKVEPLMHRIGESADVPKNYFTRTYVQGLIGRMAMHAGGYATRRTDLGANFYKDGEGKVITFDQLGTENNKAVYNRRSDWKTKYELAKKYLTECATNPGSAKFHTTDPRGVQSAEGRIYGNPYQYFFQQIMDKEYADESIYEYYMLQGNAKNSRSYAIGRTSNGGGFNAFPCKAYGQARIQPTYYYGEFDPKDMRRDVTVTVTGHNGNGYETLIPFTPNSKAAGGGLCMNKWDEGRMSKVYVKGQRNSGINGSYMRISEVFLNLAEVSAALGEENTAKTYLKKVRERAFASATEANTEGFITKSGSLLNAVLEERKFEFGGEGFRRMDMIRNGILFESISKVKESLNAMVGGLKSKGYHTFANGNTISNYVWIKLVDAKAQYSYRLTTQAPNANDPVLYPGWRGQNDDWAAQGRAFNIDFTSYDKDPKSNLAIKGLFVYIDPNGDEAKALEADGYKKTNWGADIVKYADEYSTYVFHKFNEDNAKKAPIYLWPLYPNTISASNGKITNGYGFRQQ